MDDPWGGGGVWLACGIKYSIPGGLRETYLVRLVLGESSGPREYHTSTFPRSGARSQACLGRSRVDRWG
jgi:hypothetical protein